MQLVLTYVLQHEGEYSMFQVNAKDTPTIRKDYSSIAKDLKLPEAVPHNVNKPEDLLAENAAIAAVKTRFTHPEGDWLLIIDNADNLKAPRKPGRSRLDRVYTRNKKGLHYNH